MTIAMMGKFGIKVNRDEHNTYTVSQGVYKTPVRRIRVGLKRNTLRMLN